MIILYIFQENVFNQTPPQENDEIFSGSLKPKPNIRGFCFEKPRADVVVGAVSSKPASWLLSDNSL